MDSMEKAFQDMLKETPRKTPDTGSGESVLTGHIKNEKKLRALRQEIAGNIAHSSTLRTAINKGVNSGMDDRELLVLALECIVAMTGDKVFQLNIKRIQDRA